jgi:hypothetical protein
MLKLLDKVLCVLHVVNLLLAEEVFRDIRTTHVIFDQRRVRVAIVVDLDTLPTSNTSGRHCRDVSLLQGDGVVFEAGASIVAKILTVN